MSCSTSLSLGAGVWFQVVAGGGGLNFIPEPLSFGRSSLPSKYFGSIWGRFHDRDVSNNTLSAKFSQFRQKRNAESQYSMHEPPSETRGPFRCHRTSSLQVFMLRGRPSSIPRSTPQACFIESRSRSLCCRQYESTIEFLLREYWIMIIALLSSPRLP